MCPLHRNQENAPPLQKARSGHVSKNALTITTVSMLMINAVATDVAILAKNVSAFENIWLINYSLVIFQGCYIHCVLLYLMLDSEIVISCCFIASSFMHIYLYFMVPINQ